MFFLIFHFFSFLISFLLNFFFQSPNFTFFFSKKKKDRTSVVVSRLVSHYRLLGWTDEASTVRRQARREEQNDLAIQFRAHQRNALHVGTQSNNQRHYRRQVDF